MFSFGGEKGGKSVAVVCEFDLFNFSLISFSRSASSFSSTYFSVIVDNFGITLFLHYLASITSFRTFST